MKSLRLIVMMAVSLLAAQPAFSQSSADETAKKMAARAFQILGVPKNGVVVEHRIMHDATPPYPGCTLVTSVPDALIGFTHARWACPKQPPTAPPATS